MQELYIVTGADGHLGNTIVRQLLKQKKQVRGLILPSASNKALDHLPLELVRGDLTRPATLRKLFKTDAPCTIKVIHTAGIVSIASKYQQKVFDVNVNGTRNLLKLCKQHKVRRFLYVSSVHAIAERPAGEVIAETREFIPDQLEGLYAQTKALATRLVLESRDSDFEPVVVHPSGIIGPGDYGHGHLTQLIRDYLAGRLWACVQGGYDFVDVRDVADGAIKALESASGGECFILSGHYCTVQQLLWQLHEISGKKAVKAQLPLWFAKATAPLSELYYKWKKQPPLYTSYSLYTLGTNANFSHEKATQQLGYQPRPLHDTLKDTVGWLTRQDG